MHAPVLRPLVHRAGHEPHPIGAGDAGELAGQRPGHLDGERRRIVVRLERWRQGRQVELGEHHELHMRHDAAHARHALSELAQGRVRVAEHRRALERRDRQWPH